MKTNTNSRYAVAVLIDGDNTSFEKMEDIMSFVSRYGDAVVRREKRFPHGKELPGSMDSGSYKLPPMLPERTRPILHWS